MTKTEKATQWAKDIAADNTHGYSQANRWGTPDYDCSSFVISAWEQAGVPVKTYGATYTGNMYDVFIACGFKDITSKVNLNTGSGLEAGDVLLNRTSHTCIYIGNGKVVNCRTNTDGVSGDSNGDEIREQSYWNFPWTDVLRFADEDSTTLRTTKATTSNVASASTTSASQLIPTDTKSIGVAALQGMLLYLGYSLGRCGVDGDAGSQNSYTNTALRQAVASGKIAKTTVDYLLKL